jgi:hypothetical protein
MTEGLGLEVDTLTISIPIRLQRRGGRKLIVTPQGVAAPAPKARRDETLVKALVRAHRWRRRIESGQAKSITDLAEQEGVTDAYVCRLLPLTCLAPDIVAAILDGRQPKGLRLAQMLGSRATAWSEQRTSLGSTPRRLKGRGGRKLIITPEGGMAAPEADMPWPPACSADDPLTGSLCARCD